MASLGRLDRIGRAIIDRTLDLNDVVGKRVYSSDGIDIGHVRSLRIDPLTLNTDLIVLDTDIVAGDLLIGRHYIDRIEKDVHLNMVPWEALKGKEVYDSKGVRIGRIKDVRRIATTNKVDALVVQTGRRVIEVDGRHVDHIGDHVDLRVPVEA